MDSFILERIQTVPPAFKEIIPYSTPVISFGDFMNCEVATLGINPSKHEFIYQNGNKRFEDLHTLALASHQNISKDDAEKIYFSCKTYFYGNPYRKWFDRIENHILSKMGVSYYDGSACHLDLVQWATDPIWRGLNQNIQRFLLSIDTAFLLKQLRYSPIKTLVINGLTAYQTFLNYVTVNNVKKDCLTTTNKKCMTIYGDLIFENKTIKIFGYNSNLQSTVGLTNEMREKIGVWINGIQADASLA